MFRNFQIFLSKWEIQIFKLIIIHRWYSIFQYQYFILDNNNNNNWQFSWFVSFFFFFSIVKVRDECRNSTKHIDHSFERFYFGWSREWPGQKLIYHPSLLPIDHVKRRGFESLHWNLDKMFPRDNDLIQEK